MRLRSSIISTWLPFVDISSGGAFQSGSGSTAARSTPIGSTSSGRSIRGGHPQLNDRLAEVFGSKRRSCNGGLCGNAPDNGMSRCGSFGSFSGGFRGGSGSFNFGSYGVFQGSGLGIGSGGLTALGSYRFSLWEWEWEWRFVGRGSFRGSFGSLGSLGSFGSYRFGSGSYLLGSFGSFPWGSFSGSFGAGSFRRVRAPADSSPLTSTTV